MYCSIPIICLSLLVVFEYPLDYLYLNSFVSCANKYIVDFAILGNPFIYRTNSRGPRTDPWGIPVRTGIHCEKVF